MQQAYTGFARARRSRSIADQGLTTLRSQGNSAPPHFTPEQARQWVPGGMRLFLGLLLASFACAACSEETTEKSASPWTQFVHVDGQPDPVPVQWVSTPEGKLAHSIKIPNPVPKDSGYRKGMTSKEYFDHLCKTEAGEFIFKTVDGVEGFYFMRPPKRATDTDLQDRYKLEAPEIERLFQLFRATPAARAELFVNPPWNLFRFVEEPLTKTTGTFNYIRSSGYRQRISPMTSTPTRSLISEFGLTWRGIWRFQDRELSIAGGEWIVLELKTGTVLAVMRTFGLSPRAENTPTGIWWLNASQCPGAKKHGTASDNASQLYGFISKVLTPSSQDK